MDCKSIIPCTSSSSTTWRHDVFVSFRGEDTRNNFTDHLFAALKRKHLVTFRDDKNLEKGESISAELMQAIEQSRVFIVVFSKNYATSTWCLQELAKIVDCKNVTGQIILPVFLDVDPSEVRRQIGNYGKAFSKHEERYKENLEMVQRWRETLEQVANLSGWDVLNKPQHGEIEKIVEKVISMSGNKLSSQLDGLVGIHSCYKQLEKLLVLDSNDDVRVVGICGMGGIGKTTLARALYNGIFHQYDACCFIDDVSKVYGDYGLIGVHKQLLCQILNDENPEIWNLSKANYLIKTRLCHMKALVIFDNVDKIEQMQKLAMIRELLCAGSRIIITSRDEHVLSEYGVDKIYNVQLLDHDEAYQLFCRKAFKCDYIMSCDDIMREYEEITYRVLEYAQGLPLAIEVLGSFLYGRNISEWRSALDRLKDNPKKEIMDVLQMSFDGLEQMEKEIFLNIACFFNHGEGTYVKRVLSCCGLYPDIGIRVLINKSLITVNFFEIRMHDMLVELGKKIVREKAPNEPGKWSRLWLHEDFLSVMYNKMVMENLEAIKLQLPESTSEMTTLRAEALSKMSGLKLLILKNTNFSGSLNCLSNELRYVEWESYPFTYFPSRCELTKLVELWLPYSNIKQLWEGIKPLDNLRVMDLHHSRNLIKTPDFRGMPKLKQLNLEDCTKLVEINPSIELLEKLVQLNLKNCTSLTSLPNSLFSVSSLEVLNLSGCSKLFKDQLLKKAKHLKEFEVDSPIVQCQSASFIFKKRLKLMSPFHFFYSRRHNDIVGSLIPSLPRFPSLRDLDLSFCNLHKIPEAIVLLQCLESLNLGGNNFVTLPCSIRELPRLTFLNLQHCKQLTSLSELSLRTVFPISKEARRSHWYAGFCIFDCPKLVEMESWSSIALSWMIQFLQLKNELSLDAIIVIPGTQIPRWFNHQSVGHSIYIEPLPDVHDNNWIGVAFCAAFVTHDYPTYFSNPNELPKLICSIQYRRKGSGRQVPIRLEKDLVTVEWAHLCLHYFPREHFIPLMGLMKENKDDLDRFILTMHTFGLCVEVKNCGMRLVYRQDLEELNSTVTNDALRIGIEPSHSEI